MSIINLSHEIKTILPSSLELGKDTIQITSLEQHVWSDIENKILSRLNHLKCPQLIDSTSLLLHKLISNMVNTMHHRVFQQFVESDLYLGGVSGDNFFEELYQNEIEEHGDKNIASYCRRNDTQITLGFPDDLETLLTIRYPICCDSAVYLDSKLSEALGFSLIKQYAGEASANYYLAKLTRVNSEYQSSHFPGYFPLLLTRASELDKMKAIFSKLSYGIVCFSSTGEILSISSAILDSLKLDSSSLSIQTFSKIIPPHFYNDVIWGLALETTEGIFENYRVRIKLPNDSGQSILFNISGYRSHDSTIQSLWQVVFLDPKSVDSLTEGSILNEARVHNITRNYVPQLVEQKARDVVRLGGKELTNEECYITVLFCDIVNFTAYVENNEKEESVIHTLNLVLGRISRTVNQFEGSIDKFMGDCVMVLFKNPLNAVLAALEIQKHSLDINSLRKNAGKEMLLLRIGIHWGQVIIGNIGISGRLDWTTIGDVVNTASRLEKNCQPGAVLISQILYEVIATVEQPGIKFGDIFNIKLKGKRKELTVRYVHSDDH